MLYNPPPSPLYRDAVIEPLNATEPLTTNANEPVATTPLSIVIVTFDTKPKFGEIEAVALPLAIRGVSPERSATTPVKLEPSPKYVNAFTEPLTEMEPVNCEPLIGE